MRFSDTELLKLLQSGELSMDPEPLEDRIHGVTIDLTLGNEIVRFFQPGHGVGYVDLTSDQAFASFKDHLQQKLTSRYCLQENEAFFIHPGELILAITQEKVTLSSQLVGWLDGRSCFARLGFVVHLTAHRIDPGWSGNIVLELKNLGPFPLKLRQGMTVGAISFERVEGAVKRPYHSRASSKYKDQANPIL